MKETFSNIIENSQYWKVGGYACIFFACFQLVRLLLGFIAHVFEFLKNIIDRVENRSEKDASTIIRFQEENRKLIDENINLKNKVKEFELTLELLSKLFREKSGEIDFSKFPYINSKLNELFETSDKILIDERPDLPATTSKPHGRRSVLRKMKAFVIRMIVRGK